MKNILIYGASGHSKMIVDIILKNKDHNIIGFIDSFKPTNIKVYGYDIIGDLDSLLELIDEYSIDGILIGIGDNYTRQHAFELISDMAPDIDFVSAVHPSAVLAHDVIIPRGTVIMAGVVVNADSRVGEFCILNTKSSLGHDSTMANFSSLASGVTTGGNVHIGLNCAICLKATIIQNVSIGDHTVIGAGSLVLKSIGDCKLAYGHPITTIKNRELTSKYYK